MTIREQGCDPAPSSVSGNGRVPALDGIRALAVLAVLAFHGGMPWARGGFLGVDAFFVLSGYLITVAAADRVAADWTHRACSHSGVGGLGGCCLHCCCSCSPWRSLPATSCRSRSGAAVAVTGWVRCSTWRTGGWCYAAATTSRTRRALHRSSTRGPSGVEEQFYLLCPVLLGGCWSCPAGRCGLLGALVLRCRRVEARLGGAVRPADPGGPTTAPTPGPASLLVGADPRRRPDSRPTVRATGTVASSAGDRARVGAVAVIGAAFLGWSWTHAAAPTGGSTTAVCSSRRCRSPPCWPTWRWRRTGWRHGSWLFRRCPPSG